MTSASAPVGHEPMRLRQPTHASSRTITGRRRTFGGVDANGRRASNGQKGMHRSHPVQSLASMATIDCPMFTAPTWFFTIRSMQSTDNRLVPHHHMDGRLDRLSSMLRRRGVLSPAFEPYGGVRGLAAYGPVGGTIRSRFISTWLDHWAQHGDLVEIGAPVVTPYEVLDASGHVDQFTDPIATCSACGETHRADHLIGEEAEGWSIEDIRASFIEDPPGCTSCGSQSSMRSRNRT